MLASFFTLNNNYILFSLNKPSNLYYYQFNTYAWQSSYAYCLLRRIFLTRRIPEREPVRARRDRRSQDKKL